ncbi:MAG: hypothetical protein IJ004_02255 [Clostridia bacterium]|nr:hypothetical protein [Clostridia bacterium]
MKKTIICISLALIMLLSLTSCFKSENKYDYTMSDYITIPDFIGHKVEFALDSLQASIDSQLAKNAKEYTVSVGDEIYVDVEFYKITYLVDEETGKQYDQQGDKIEELSQSNMKLVVGSGKLGRILENGILGSAIGDIIDNKYKDSLISQLDDIYPDLELPEGKTINDYIKDGVKVVIKVLNKQIKAGDVVSVAFKGFRLDDDGNIAKNAEGKDDIFDESDGSSFFIGSELAIKDFENNLIGMFIGDAHEKEFLATFPEDYIDESLKGETVLFRVKVKGLYVPPVYNNDFVKAYFDYDTTEDFENELINQFVVSAMYDYVLKNCTIISYPTEEYNAAMKELSDIEASFEKQYKVSLDSYIKSEYNMTREEYVKSNMKTEMIYYAISQQNLLIPTEALLKNEREKCIAYYKDYYMQNSSMNAETAYSEAVAFVDTLGPSYIYENVMFNLVDTFFKEKAELVKLDKTYTSISETIAKEEAPSDK